MSSPAMTERLDAGIDVLLADGDAAISNVDVSVAELLGIAAELRTLPRGDFLSQLKVSLMESVRETSTSGESEVMASAIIGGGTNTQRPSGSSKEQILPSLFGQGTGTYAVRRSNFAFSVLAHAVALILIISSGFWIQQHHGYSVQTIQLVEAPVSDYLALDNATKPSGGGGGGGACTSTYGRGGGCGAWI